MQIVSEARIFDAALLALVDAVEVARDTERWCVVGGHMVNLHCLRAGVDMPIRMTRDADLAVEIMSIRHGPIVENLHTRGYRNESSGNRFERLVKPGQRATIDVLVPSYTFATEPNLDVGPIVVDGFPGVSTAMGRTIAVELRAILTDGGRLEAEIRIPDVLAAIVLKAFAYARRFATSDAQDLFRLLEVAHADGQTTADWPDGSDFREAARLLSQHFDRPGRGIREAAPAQPERFRALVRALIGPPRS